MRQEEPFLHPLPEGFLHKPVLQGVIAQHHHPPTGLHVPVEPFQGLAPALAHRYAEALGKLRDVDPDVTLIITESNPQLLRSFARRTLTIERGEIAEDTAKEKAA